MTSLALRAHPSASGQRNSTTETHPYEFLISFHTNSLRSLLYIEATRTDAKRTAVEDLPCTSKVLPEKTRPFGIA